MRASRPPGPGRLALLAVAAGVLACAGPARGLDPERAVTQYATRIWQLEHGLPHNSIITLAQTPDGYLWCGTENGLARFDGQSFTVFDRTNTPAIRNNVMHALCADRSGRLWIGTGGGGLVRYERGTFTQFSVAHGLAGDVVQGIAEDGSGALWVGTSTGLSRYANGKFTTYTSNDGLPTNYCRAVCIDAGGVMWVGTGKGLCRFHDGRVTTYTSTDGLPNNNVQALVPARDGGVWIGTHGSGFSHWRDGKFTNYGEAEGLPSGFVRNISEDRDGNLWLATNEGIVRWRTGRVTGRFPRGGVTGGLTFSLLEDRDGNVWAGTVDGVVRLRNGRCMAHATSEGLGSDQVWSVYEDRDGNLWAGTGAGLNCRRDGKWATYTTGDGLPSNTVLSITQDATGAMWFGTSAGLARFRDGRFQSFTAADGLSGSVAVAVYTDRQGTLWVGFNGGGVDRYRDGRFTPVTAGDGFRDAIARYFHEDRHGNMWVATAGAGLWVLTESGATRYTTREGLASDLILTVLEGTDGTMWVGTHGGGLNWLRDGRWSHVNSSNGLPDDIIYQIIEDGPHLWLSSSKGVFRVAKDELSRGTVRPLHLGKNDGMRILDCSGGTQPAGCRSRTGHIWFATTRGLVSIDPTTVRASTTAPQVLVTNVVADGIAVDPEGTFTVPPGRGKLEFHYTAVDLSAAEGVGFRYKLEGFDENWVEAGNRRAAFYTNLPPGRYHFRVTAHNADGVWRNEPTQLAIVLEPHAYQTWWFAALGAIAAVGLLWAGYVVRTRTHRARERYLARCVAERTSALQKEIEEHAQTGERLRQAQKLEAIGQLAGGVAHDFNNLLTIINGFVELLLARPDRDDRERAILLDILTAGHRAGGLTQQLLAFSRRQVLEPKVLDPNAVITETERMLRRVIGEDVALAVTLEPRVYRVKADPVQLQQVLLNFAVNARDAMPRGGRFTIETRNETIDAERARENPDAAPGEYAVLVATDTGCGMAPDVKGRVFEPFFTTKGPGKGTGLGLATVYGIVRQSGGFVAVDSEVGTGTRFRVYLPRAEGEPTEVPRPQTDPAAAPVPRGGETVLLVEDEPSVRAVARHVLASCGYAVLEADDGESALRVAAAHPGRIDVLVTDVVMPNMGGRHLAEELRRQRPGVRVLFLSGYTDDVVLRHGVSDEEVAFLQKPYSPAVLAAKVRAVLDSPSRNGAPQPG